MWLVANGVKPALEQARNLTAATSARHYHARPGREVTLDRCRLPSVQARQVPFVLVVPELLVSNEFPSGLVEEFVKACPVLPREETEPEAVEDRVDVGKHPVSPVQSCPVHPHSRRSLGEATSHGRAIDRKS